VSSYSCDGRRSDTIINGNTGIQDGQWMGLCVENPSVQRHYIIGREQKIKVLQCFGKEEALLYIVTLWRH